MGVPVLAPWVKANFGILLAFSYCIVERLGNE